MLSEDNKEINKPDPEKEELLELIHHMFSQACWYDGKYDHLCLSAYEDAQQALIRYGRIKQEDCHRR